MSASKTLIECLLKHAADMPAHCAVVSGPLCLSYEALAERVVVHAAGLKAMGVLDTSVVGISCDDDVQHLLICLAVAYCGATSCTIPSYESPERRKALAEKVGITHLVDGSTELPSAMVDSNPLIPSNSAAGVLFSTSGTTGEPKIVVHHSVDIVLQAPRHITSSQERFACLASMEHNFSKRHRLYCVAQGATNVFVERTTATLVQQCLTLDVNTLHLTAFQAQELLAADGCDRLSGLRLKLGGSHVPAALRNSLREQITRTIQFGYGTTETGAIAFTEPDDPASGESVGMPLAGIEVSIVDANREPVASGDSGEIAIRCAGMFRQYRGQADMTAERLSNGWFYCGDLGQLDEQGRITLHGRADDMFVFNSINIYPQDIESTICQYPGVKDAAVLPQHSATHGDIPVSLVVFNDEVEPDLKSLKKFLRGELGLRCPRQIKVASEVPRNAPGKILRAEAIALFEAS